MISGLPLLGVFGAVLLGVGVAWLGISAPSSTIGNIPTFGVCICVAFVIQWIFFVPSFILKSERFFDLIGSLTFLTVIALALLATDEISIRAGVASILVAVWATRLGSFLYLRVHRAKFDRRFREIRENFSLFLMTFTLQGLWVSLTVAPALVVLTAVNHVPIGLFFFVGIFLWIVGFGLEVVADYQKTQFREDPDNRDDFIRTGLWSWSQHPNYFGEILLWIGMAVIAYPVMQGFQLALLLSVVFVWVLLTRISGIRMLDARAQRKWGDQEDYQEYTRKTSKLLLWPPSR